MVSLFSGSLAVGPRARDEKLPIVSKVCLVFLFFFFYRDCGNYMRQGQGKKKGTGKRRVEECGY